MRPVQQTGFSVFRFLREFGQETHADEARAARWHIAHAVTYGIMIFLYVGSALWHVGAAARHHRAVRLLESAGRAGTAEMDDNQGC